jgi:rubrerythrin
MIRSFTVLEILGIAIQSEIESAKYYKHIKRLVKSPLLKDKLNFLAVEEIKHKHILFEYYKSKFPEVRLSMPISSSVPRPLIPKKGKVPVSVLLGAALKAEKESEKFYTMMLKYVNDAQGMLLLRYLAKVESSHYHILKNEVELIEQGKRVKEMRSLYQTDEIIHVGP